MVKISANRIDLETKRLERAQLRNYTETLVTVTASATTTLDLSTGNVFDLTHGTNITTLTLSNTPASGSYCTITIIRNKDASGTARTIAWPASFKWPQGTAPTLTQTTGAIDVIVATTKNGGTTWFATLAGQAVAVVPTATLFSWGQNTVGQLGLGDTTNRSSPVQVGALATWASVSSGYKDVGATKTDGTAWGWGENPYGQLGDGSTTNRSSPVQVGALTNWSQVSSGRWSKHALKTDGTLWSWGRNQYGQLGDGSTTNRSSPVQVGTLTTWAQISAGDAQLMAIKTDGTLWVCGYNGSGQLGLGDITSRSSPVQVGALTTWARVSANCKHTLAVKTDGTLWVWGFGSYGRLGKGNTTNYSSPVQVGALTNWAQVSAGYQHSMAIKTDGTLWAIGGQNNYGKLGLGDTTHRSSPVQVGALTNWASVGGSGRHTVARKTDGTIWAWGQNSYGKLGDGTTTVRSSPVQVGALTTWVQISGGMHQSSAIQA